mmetsp:Transcript_34442/g.50350  ORF Transcript_34442/g.50350 Transcript_34442/m.50350 type:complete len:132 (+) Transcript_34442:182-577(+)
MESQILDEIRMSVCKPLGGLDEKVNEEVLHAAFIPFGDIIEVNIPKDYEQDNKNRGFGFVHFEEEEDAAAAMENMEGAEIYGRVVKVNIARPMTHKLGASKPVWSAEEWFEKNVKDEDNEPVPEDSLIPDA